jgi:hypothetical protein
MWHKYLRRERGKINKRFLLQETTSTVATRHEETSGTALGRNRSFLAPSGRIDCAAAAASLRSHSHTATEQMRRREEGGGGLHRASETGECRVADHRGGMPVGGDLRRTYAAAEQRRRKGSSAMRRIYASGDGSPCCGGWATAQDLCLPSSRGGDGRREEGPVGVRASAAARRVPPPPVATALARADEEAKEDAFLHIDMLVESRRCARCVCREAQGAQRGDQGAGSRLAGELAWRCSLQGKVLAAASAHACAWPESRLIVIAPCGARAHRAPRLRLAGQRGGGAERRRVCVHARATGAPGSQLVAAPCTPPRVGHRAGARRAKRTAARTPERYHSLQPARCARSSPLLLAIGRGPCRTLHGWRDFSQRLQERKGERKR